MILTYQANKQASKQTSKKTGFTVDPIWWGSLRLAPIIADAITNKTAKYRLLYCRLLY